jgi:hypothetical protein
MNRTGDTWSSESIDSSFSYSADPMGEPKVRLDGSGNPHVVWRKGLDPEVYYKSRSGGVWSDISNVSETSSQDSVYPSLAIDSEGNAHVCWLETASVVEVAYKYHSFTHDPALQAGATGGNDWFYTSYFGTTDTTDDFSAKLNTLLVDCNCTSCSKNTTHCTIGLNLTSDAPGAITLSNLRITG